MKPRFDRPLLPLRRESHREPRKRSLTIFGSGHTEGKYLVRKVLIMLLVAFISVSGIAHADGSVENGTLLEGTLSAGLSSASAHVGDPVVIENVHDASGTISGTLYGHITQVQPAGRGQHAQLDFVIDRLATAGSSYSVVAVSKGITPPGANAGREETAALVGALAGALLGKALGHSSGAVIAGAVAGAGTGFLLTSNNYQDIVLPQGSSVKVLLQSVTRMQSN